MNSSKSAIDCRKALLRYFDPRVNMVMPNIYLCGGEMDLAVLTRAGYLTEVEIKISVQDWKADAHKRKWDYPERKYVNRFYYCLGPGIPLDAVEVPEQFGVLHVSPNGRLQIHRKAQLLSKEKNASIRKQMMVVAYYRFWLSKTAADIPIDEQTMKSLQEDLLFV